MLHNSNGRIYKGLIRQFIDILIKDKGLKIVILINRGILRFSETSSRNYENNKHCSQNIKKKTNLI